MHPALHCVFGIRCTDFSMIAADQMTALNCCIMNNDMDKLYPVTDKLLMGVTGEPGDAIQITDFIVKNIKLYHLKNGYQPSINAAVNMTRNTVASIFRTAGPLSVNMLIAGYDEEAGALLYFVDEVATCVEMPFAAQGICGALTMSIMQQYYRPTMTEMEAYEVIQMCVREIHKRWFLNLTNFQVKVVSASGITTLPTIRPETSNQLETRAGDFKNFFLNV